MRYDPSFNPARTYYYAQDHEGSVTYLLNTSGNVVESYKYDAFGLPTIYDGNGTQISSSAYSNRFLFTGREYANLFGFYEYRARAYHPGLGRFMSEDPKLFDAGDYHLFRYCHNDPVDFTDPMGLEDIAISRDLDKLGVQASINSLRAAIAAKDGMGRSQLIQQRVNGGLNKPVLQNKINVGEKKTETRRDSNGHFLNGAATRSVMEEGGKPDTGFGEIGRGHVHMNLSGNGEAKFSDRDIKLATGDSSNGTRGEPVWRVDESNPGQVYRLTPQTNPGEAPTINKIDVNQFDPSILKGIQEAQKDSANAEHGINPKVP
jgi:RHS repeat-associated protein